MTGGDARLLVDAWRRWREIAREDAPYRVAVLASYTADPLVPHLGLALHDSGMPAHVEVGPYNQIAQQCVDPGSATAQAEPDVLLVAPRFEECWGRPPRLDDPDDVDHAAELLMLADEALAASTRWNATLVFVLPALPEDRPFGIGDHGLHRGVVATATMVREALRDRLAGRPNVGLLDAEAVVRSVGVANAHTPMLHRLAGIPYSDTVFAGLADQAARLLRLRLQPAGSVVAVDVDSLLRDGAGPRSGGELLRPILDQLRHNGSRTVAISRAQPDAMWPIVRSLFGDGWEDLVDDWEFVDDTWTPVGRLLTADAGSWPDPTGVVGIGADAEMWAANLVGSPVWDQVPPLDSPRPTPAVAAGEPAAPVSLAGYIAGLGVSVDWRPMDGELLPAIAEMAEKTKDFTLGIAHDEDSLAALVEDDDSTILVGEVRDRLGDYGHAVACGVRFADGSGVVDPFYVSCPAMGRGVEDNTIARIIELAVQRQCDTLVFRHVATGRNDAALRFLRDISAQAGPVRILVEELPTDAGTAVAV
ncbi:hypothetical protein [Kutzneria sp. CA-103260]|uniref:hypothetical protein n=1 Tax=Kutzneria sp. CA-103260 TaxID=2802641 RepID=UPI001BA893BD|nr:hypothetical protein [Kutzneria sp. CA-103260]QUQ67036.1 type I polyketide synthase [Kutzneria sp. CA-103260]